MTAQNRAPGASLERLGWLDEMTSGELARGTDSSSHPANKSVNIKRPPLCDECGVKRSDPPSRLCPGCQAYQEHQ
jgi:hypothetical protein